MSHHSQTETPEAPPLDRRLPEEAWAWVEGQTQALPAEAVPVERSLGRVLAQALSTPKDIPATRSAAGDGYAVVADATTGAGAYNPLPLRLRVAERDGTLDSGEACPVVWGQALPLGADAVLSLEDAERTAHGIEVYGAVASGEHVIPIGEEAHAKESLLEAGRRLRPQDLAWLRLLGQERVEVLRQPRVSLVLTSPPAADVVAEMVAALVQRDGGLVTSITSAHRNRGGLAERLGEQNVDVMLVVGGTGIGPNDHAAAVLAELGQLDIRGVAIRPGDTLSLGRIDQRPVCLLPGPPLACLSAYDLVAGRLVRGLAGRGSDWPYRAVDATLARKIASPVGSLELCPVRLRASQAEPLDRAGGRPLRSAVTADGFVVVPLQSEGHPDGARVTVFLYEG